METYTHRNISTLQLITMSTFINSQIYPKFNILRSRFLEYWYKYFLARQVLHVDNRVTTAGEMEHSRNSAKALEALEGCTYFNDSHLNSFNPINPSFESCQVSCQHPQPTTHHFIFEDTLETPLIVSTAFGTTKKIFIIFMSCCVERRNFWGKLSGTQGQRLQDLVVPNN